MSQTVAEHVGHQAPSTTSDRLMLVAGDSHCGPSAAQMRPYCPAALLDEYDAFWTAVGEHPMEMFLPHLGVPVDHQERIRHSGQVAGNQDMAARLRDMDADGVAADVIYHGAQNFQPLPFGGILGLGMPDGGDRSREVAGIEMFNSWLADWTSDEPHRHVGIAQLPMWDLDLAIAEVRRVRAAGLTSVNFPAPRPALPGYDAPHWEPFWSVCEDLGVVLSSHAGAGAAGGPTPEPGPAALPITMCEGTFLSRRGVYFLVLGGVFERHPGLKLVLTEQAGDWAAEMMSDMDSVYLSPQGALLREVLPEMPSTYFRRNVFVGDSFMSRREARLAVDAGLERNFLWGSDYPHEEGTWPVTLLSLRATFAGLDPTAIKAMAGENAASVYGLDVDRLRDVADRIGPTIAEVSEPLDALPDGHRGFAFREIGKWA
jgi:predicted TIM-barrel fold metal-dependent hydrolase